MNPAQKQALAIKKTFEKLALKEDLTLLEANYFCYTEDGETVRVQLSITPLPPPPPDPKIIKEINQLVDQIRSKQFTLTRRLMDETFLTVKVQSAVESNFTVYFPYQDAYISNRLDKFKTDLPFSKVKRLLKDQTNRGVCETYAELLLQTPEYKKFKKEVDILAKKVRKLVDSLNIGYFRIWEAMRKT